jgi:hypothetical protein
MTKEFPITNPQSPGAGNHFVIRAWSFFRHYGLVIRHSMEMRLSRGHRPTPVLIKITHHQQSGCPGFAV